MKCTTHPEIDATGTCFYSGKPYCGNCLVEVDGRLIGKNKVEVGEGRLKGQRIAMAGLIMGYVRPAAALLVAGVLIFSSLAIPRLLRSRQADNESSTVANLRTINTAEITYLSEHDTYGTIRDLVTEGLLDSRFNGIVVGYSFDIHAEGSNYLATAIPTSLSVGRFGYFSLPDAVIRYAKEESTTCNPCFPMGMSGQPVNSSAASAGIPAIKMAAKITNKTTVTEAESSVTGQPSDNSDIERLIAESEANSDALLEKGTSGSVLLSTATRDELITQALQINETLPRMMNDGSRLEKVHYDRGRLIWDYAVMLSTGYMAPDEFSRAQEKVATSGKLAQRMTTCGESASKLYLDKGITLAFSYRDKDGVPIAEFEVTRADCERQNNSVNTRVPGGG